MVRSLIPWTERLPRPISRLEEEMENLMGRFFRPEEAWITPEVMVPRANLVETENGFEVTVDLPGMKPEDVNVEVKNGNLWISGESKEEKEEKGKTYHRIERRSGEFRRVFTLPMPVAEEKISAEYKEGVLSVVLPKTEETKPKQIEVTS